MNRPMLAAKLFGKEDYITNDLVYHRILKDVRFPVAATPKADGIRGIKQGVLLSRSFKPLPNLQLQERAKVLPEGFDVECFTLSLPYDQIESVVMSRDKDASAIQFHVIDWFSPTLGYVDRIGNASQISLPVTYLMPTLCGTVEELLHFEGQCLEQGYEGICWRHPQSYYKEGRATIREGGLTKLKRVLYETATIAGFIEEQDNLNDDTTNELGYTERSDHQANKIGKGRLGAFWVDSKFGRHKVFGFTDQQKVVFWEQRDSLLGKELTFKHTPHGMKELPRHPVFKQMGRIIV